MKRSILNTISACCLVLLFIGCAVGQKIRYNAIPLDLKASGTYIIAVSALDSRSYVKNGEKDPTYIGTFRGGFGNPFNVTTESGKPLSEDMTDVICDSLKTKGFSAKGFPLKFSDSLDQAINTMKTSNAKRLILLAIIEWHSNTMTNTSLYFNLTLTVMDGQGKMLAEAKTKAEEEDLGGSIMNPPGHAKEAVPAAFKKKMELLLNDPKVVDALS